MEVEIEDIFEVCRLNVQLVEICNLYSTRLRKLRLQPYRDEDSFNSYKTEEWYRVRDEFRREINKYISFRVARFHILCENRQWIHAITYLVSLARISTWGWKGKHPRFFVMAAQRIPFEIFSYYLSTFETYLGVDFFKKWARRT